MAASILRTGEAVNLMIDKDQHRGLRGLRRFASVMAAVAATIVSGAGLATGAFAQDGTVVIGGSGAPDVQVDLNAIYGGGPATPYSPTGRRLLMPNAGKFHAIKLRPPGSSSGVKHAVKTAPEKTAKAEAAATQATGEPTGDEPLIPPPSAEPAPPAPPPSASTPTPLSKSAEEPPPPAQKTLPVESAPLAPPAAKSTVPAKAAGKMAEAAPETPPPAPGKTEAPPPPPPAPAPAASKTKSAAPPPPPAPVTPGPATSAETAPPPPPTANPQVAALPPAPSFSMEKPTAIPFTVGASTLADPAKQTLGSVAQTLNGNADLRLQIVAYATGSDDNASQARRLSLSRALAVRSFLIDAGIRSTRMDVRALGNKFDSGPGDRVDLIVVKP